MCAARLAESGYVCGVCVCSGTITVRGGGNSVAYPVLRADIPAAMSAIHVIGGVILPRQQNATATPASE